MLAGNRVCSPGFLGTMQGRPKMGACVRPAISVSWQPNRCGLGGARRAGQWSRSRRASPKQSGICQQGNLRRYRRRIDRARRSASTLRSQTRSQSCRDQRHQLNRAPTPPRPAQGRWAAGAASHTARPNEFRRPAPPFRRRHAAPARPPPAPRELDRCDDFDPPVRHVTIPKRNHMTHPPQLIRRWPQPDGCATNRIDRNRIGGQDGRQY